jgi:hypothetical protein
VNVVQLHLSNLTFNVNNSLPLQSRQTTKLRLRVMNKSCFMPNWEGRMGISRADFLHSCCFAAMVETGRGSNCGSTENQSDVMKLNI